MPFNLSIRSSQNQSINLDWPDLETSLQILLNDSKIVNSSQNTFWIHFAIIFKSPRKEILFESENYLLCLKPMNEIEKLKKGIENFLSSSQESYYFEPIEPNFEIRLERTQDNKFKFFCWIDNGNADLTHYTWDSFGVRLYVNSEEINNFLIQLNNVVQSPQINSSLKIQD